LAKDVVRRCPFKRQRHLRVRRQTSQPATVGL
jgi:hypothetical protein